MRTISAALLGLVLAGLAALEWRAQVGATDPRIGLKGGFRDAAQAAWNMRLVASLPKPEGFFDPAAPYGNPTPPERQPAQGDAEANPNTVGPDVLVPVNPATPSRPAVFDPKIANRLSFTNSDMAFSGQRLIAGS